nr:RNA-directed DNA polymerase, eukaryota [Tanacetum cinerariifolium]
MESVSLSHSCDRWICDLSGDGEFRVKEVRNFLDNLFLPSYADATRWVKYIPVKINVFVWRARRDFLPTRVNLSRRVNALLEGVFCVAWWSIWGFRNRTIYNEMPPRTSMLFDDIMSLFFNWYSSRCNRAITGILG